MSIQFRILGGFLLVLLLTVAVAGVGWHGFESYAARVNAASTAERLVSEINDLGLAATLSLEAGSQERQSAVGASLGKVRATLADLSHTSTGGNAAVADAVTHMMRSVDDFDRAVKEYAEQQQKKLALAAAHRAVVDRFQSLAARIVTAQEAQMKETSDTLSKGWADEKALAPLMTLAAISANQMLELRAAEASFVVTHGADARAEIDDILKRMPRAMGFLKTHSSVEEPAQQILDLVTKYEAALDDATKGEGQAGGLRVISADLSTAARHIVESLHNEDVTLVHKLQGSEWALGKSSELLNIATRIIGSTQRAQAQELTFLFTDDKDAAAAVDATAQEIAEQGKTIVSWITEDDQRMMIDDLVREIDGYRQSIPELAMAKAAQETLRQRLDASREAVVSDAQQISRNEMNRMREEQRRATLLLFGGVALAVLFGAILSWVIGRSIIGPLRQLVEVMGRLAAGDKDIDIPGRHRRDELRLVAAAVEVFRDNALAMDRMHEDQQRLKQEAEAERRSALLGVADTFDRTIQGVVNSIGTAAHEMRGTATNLTAMAERTTSQAGAAANAARNALDNVDTVAAAANELTASIAEISRQVDHSVRIAIEAQTAAERTNDQVLGLTQAAEKVESVVQLIQDIASQTNLLALNATIEAARAGDAGRGFAVVAGEVKALAAQTARATEDIAGQISSIQSATRQSATTIRGIGKIVAQVNEIATMIAAAVEQQDKATQEIGQSIQRAAADTGVAASNIGGLTEAASATDNAADSVLGAASTLAEHTDLLRSQVKSFLDQVRAA